MDKLTKIFILSASITILIGCGSSTTSNSYRNSNSNSPVTTASNVKKTGQSNSYDENGSLITDGSIKDDGYYSNKTGITSNYSRDNSKDIVTDHITSLEWQDNSDTVRVQKSWDDALSYCDNLSLDGGGWRLPNIDELMYIANRSKQQPAIDSNYFNNTASSLYWTENTSGDKAWCVNFSEGFDVAEDKNSNLYVRCVRNK